MNDTPAALAVYVDTAINLLPVRQFDGKLVAALEPIPVDTRAVTA